MLRVQTDQGHSRGTPVRGGSGFTPLSGNPVTFSQVTGNRPCQGGGGSGRPAYIVIFRHCDEDYSTQAKCRSSAKYSGYQGCQGCEYLKSSVCATNNCSGNGVLRAYGYGKWLSCFSAQNDVEIGAIFSQNPTGAQTNARPMTTASILYDSLLRLTGMPPNQLCWAQFDRTAASSPTATKNPMVAALGSSAYNNKTVAIVWDHGNVQFVLQALGVNINNWWWNGCCYDQAVVVNMKTREMVTYRLNTFGSNPDPCSGTICQAASNPYPGCPGPWPVTVSAGAKSRMTTTGSHVDLNAGSGLNDLATAIDGDGAGQVNPGAKMSWRGSTGGSSRYGRGSASDCGSTEGAVGTSMVALDALNLSPTSTTFDTSTYFDTSTTFDSAPTSASFNGASLNF